MSTTDIVQKLWNLCHVLRDDGITYHQYVTELTYLLFLKMMKETDQEKHLPKGYRWGDLETKDGIEQLHFYRALLLHLGTEGSGRVQAIFANATTSLKVPRNLKKLVDAIDGLDWYSARTEGLGDLYEGLLEKNAAEKKSGAGQYFTPRPLIDSMVHLVKPQPGEKVQDPAAGTAGFLIAADRYIKGETDQLFTLDAKEQAFQKKKAFYGVELVPDAHRLALMNLMLHDIEGELSLGDTLSSLGTQLDKADVILTNPPFGTKKGGGLPTRDDFTFPTSNKQLAFLQHIYRGLRPGGRAAVVLPDNVLFEENTGTEIRRDLMEKCDLHTILRLPTGIFYAQGVKTNVLFFTRGATDKGHTKAVWVFDMRANMPSFGKRTPLGRDHFAEFEAAFGKDPLGKSKRKDQGEAGRFRKFTREEIRGRGDNLDIAWLKDESVRGADDLPEPEEIADEILERLRVAVAEIEGLRAELEVGA
ncbi:N-6 DNA methylase [Polyangium fumosum]|uniref:site-specific DNA-methyltransferase (adenine-specific) n=1 Tax=Polyangium fumosum TaxID=889272 RepID=A0A4U1JHY8_9BACT|nr:N-6 DNA methylase [Polyangium fumosum]TKD10356.1 SAM-dependent methyltransferase [Polyangium fumosum]